MGSMKGGGAKEEGEEDGEDEALMGLRVEFAAMRDSIVN